VHSDDSRALGRRSATRADDDLSDDLNDADPRPGQKPVKHASARSGQPTTQPATSHPTSCTAGWPTLADLTVTVTRAAHPGRRTERTRPNQTQSPPLATSRQEDLSRDHHHRNDHQNQPGSTHPHHASGGHTMIINPTSNPTTITPSTSPHAAPAERQAAHRSPRPIRGVINDRTRPPDT